MSSQPPPPVEAFLLTDVGRKRPHNEDYVGYFVPEDLQELAANGQLFIVADGAGGAAAGEVASQYATRKALHDYFELSEPDLEKRLVAAIRSANADLYEYAVSSDKPRMATTMVAALIRGSEMRIANVGDSRAYLVRGNTIRQITRDHSLVDQLLREGAITPEEARNHARRGVLLRSLGSESKVAVDVFTGTLQSGDIIVLCSDGLTRHVDDQEIGQIVIDWSGEDACRRLVQMANERGGGDNISVIILRFDPLSVPTLDDSLRHSTPVTLSPASDVPSLSEMGTLAAASTPRRDLTGKPKTLAPLPEPVPLSERVKNLPWSDIGMGIAVAVAAALIVAAIGFWLPNLGLGIGGQQDAELPATTVSSVTTVTPTPEPTSEELAGIGQATALPVTLTPSLTPTPDPNLTGAAAIYEGEFPYGATPLQSEQALDLCAQLGGQCLLEYFEDAEPAVRIYLDLFYIDRTEVTNAAYRACVEAGSCVEPKGLEVEGLGITDYYLNEAYRDYPAVGVSWSQADAYCRWAGGRLPTEAEWEKAASWDEGTDEKLVWPWGQEWKPEWVNYRDPDKPVGEPEKVRSHPENASPYGLFDMAGNVSEWVADWYADDYYESLVGGQANPQGPESPGDEPYKVLRGGSWADNGVFTRTVHRLFVLEDHFNKSIGFRCAYDENPEPSPGPGAGASDALPLIPGDETTPTPAP